MTNSVELQVICRLLTTQDASEVDRLCSFDDSYYSVFKDQIKFILEHREKYGDVPDLFTFQAQFEDVVIVEVNEPVTYLEDQLRKNKQHILFLQTFNKLTDLGSADVSEAWAYLQSQCEKAASLDSSNPVNIVTDAFKRSDEIIAFNKQKRIPTGFKELDKVMYGGLSTVEELCLIVARTNSGKSWVCTKMMECAQLNGFPVLYYSPEMQSSFIGTRFDTWRGHFKNSELQRGMYNEEYFNYLKKLVTEETGALVVEDKDMSEGKTTVRAMENLVKKHHIKLLIIDGLSYMSDIERADSDVLRYKNICNSLFRLSKTYGCAVVVAVQANRETKGNTDEKGIPFPDLTNIEGSDHPGRIATQVFALRQLFEEHTLEIKLLKSRNAKNTNQTFAYVWDPNTGSTEYISDSSDSDSPPPPPSAPSQLPKLSTFTVSAKIIHNEPDESIISDDDDDLDDVEF